jgi:hypothetical protein
VHYSFVPSPGRRARHGGGDYNSIRVHRALQGAVLLRHDEAMNTDEVDAGAEIDAIVARVGGWRAATLAELRRVILSSDSHIVEAIKWRKPSRPEGVATWMSDGNICMADLLKNAVRLTFPKGAQVDDPTKVFNTRLDSSTVRAVDFFENSRIDDDALRQLVRRAVALNR